MKKERIFSVLVLGLCAVWFFESQSIPEATMPGAPGPKFFPYLVMGLLSLFAILQFALTFRRVENQPFPPVPLSPLEEQEKDIEKGGCIDPDELSPDRKYTAAAFFLIFFYALGIDFFGFYPATLPAVFFSLLLAVKGKMQWYNLLAGTAIIVSAIYGIFTIALRVPLPSGKIW